MFVSTSDALPAIFNKRVCVQQCSSKHLDLPGTGYSFSHISPEGTVRKPHVFISLSGLSVALPARFVLHYERDGAAACLRGGRRGEEGRGLLFVSSLLYLQPEAVVLFLL